MTPATIYHATTPKKAKLYRESGFIKGPVRGFDTLLAAMAWAVKVERKVIYAVTPVGPVNKLPDHHNDFGCAWWTETVPLSNIKCAYSAGDALPAKRGRSKK